MAKSSKEEAVTVTLPSRRGFRVYESNPSLEEGLTTRTKFRIPATTGGAIVVAQETGVILGKGAIGFVEEKEVDPEEFVKIYLAGVRKYGELSKAGALLFEYVYHQMSGADGKDKDMVALSLHWARKWKADLSERTYQRGLSELLAKQFIFRSFSTDMYFVNVRFMFNGDRIALVQSYRRRDKKKGGEEKQNELPLE
jgi:hypothetical protein